MLKVREEIKGLTRKELMNKAIKNKGMHDKDVIAFCAVCEGDLTLIGLYSLSIRHSLCSGCGEHR